MKEPEMKLADTHRRGFLTRSSALSMGMLALPLAACGDGIVTEARAAQDTAEPAAGAGYTIDTSIQSPNQDSRARTLVMHYTALSLAESIRVLTDPQRQVSAHYLVPDAADAGVSFKVFQLVPEARRAWHAGVSYWQGDRMLNASSVGIEIVNLGFPAADQMLPVMNRRWYPYPDAQVAVFAAIAADVIRRHKIPPHKVVAHSDIAPGRKFDPGPLFPWRKLYERYQVGAWPEAEAVAYYQANRPYRGDVSELQAKLLAYGYDTPQTGRLDAQTLNVVSAFQMHFRPSRYDGIPDAETVAVLDALLEKYFKRSRSLQRQVMPGEPSPASEGGERGHDEWPMAVPR